MNARVKVRALSAENTSKKRPIEVKKILLSPSTWIVIIAIAGLSFTFYRSVSKNNEIRNIFNIRKLRISNF